MIKEGKKVPAFCLPNQDGAKRCLKDLLAELPENGFLLLFFYPKDNTPGCTQEAKGFSENKRKFSARRIKVVGISKLSAESKKRFAEKHNLTVELLADEEEKVAEKYGVRKEKTRFGKTYIGINRESFLIDPTGKLIKHWHTVKPATHPQEVLDFVAGWRKSQKKR